MEVPVNSILQLTCAAQGEPPPIIKWLLNDTCLVSMSSRPQPKLAMLVDIVFQVMEDRRPADTNTLEVFNTSLSEDSGFYTCVARNTVGTDQHTILVQITDVTSK